MSLICYVSKRFSPEKMDMIAKANVIIESYMAQGYNLSIRQLFYRFVTHKYIPNHPKYYDILEDLMTHARLAGLVHWEAIVDRTRGLVQREHWQKPSQMMETAANEYHINMWWTQPHYVEVWVEKSALEEVVAKACVPLDVPFYACRGYDSWSGAWKASQRLLGKVKSGKEVHILHLGDHDPSGLHMSQDIKKRVQLMMRDNPVHVRRIALNMSQIDKFKPEPDPAKVRDPRFKKYEQEFGDESWELDSLEPRELEVIIQNNIKLFIDEKLWKESESLLKRGKDTMQYFVQYYPQLVQHIRALCKADAAGDPIVCQGCLATRNNPVCRCAVGGGIATHELGTGE